MATRILQTWKRQAGQLKVETYAIYLAYKDPRVPWYAKILVVCVIGYVLSPIDKFLDSVPIIGYLDHLILVPIGVILAFKKMIPRAVLTDCRERARVAIHRKKPTNRVPDFIIIFVWLLSGSLAVVFARWVIIDWNGVFMWWLRWVIRITKFGNHLPA